MFNSKLVPDIKCSFSWRPLWVETKRETSCYKHILGKCRRSVASPYNLLTFMLRIVNHSFQQVEFGRNPIKSEVIESCSETQTERDIWSFPVKEQPHQPWTRSVNTFSSTFLENKCACSLGEQMGEYQYLCLD